MQLKFFDKVKVISHRGASGHAPENTLASFNKAIELGSSCVEFDVMLSSDEEPFVFHDFSLARTTNGRGNFGKATSSYLSTLDAGQWFSSDFLGEKIPHFHQVLMWLGEHSVQANIEIKPYPGTTEQTTRVVLNYIKRYWPANKPWPLISSFEYEALELCHKHAPELPLGLLLHRWQPNWQSLAQRINASSINLNQSILTQSRIQEIKEAGYSLLAYTVNKKQQAEELLNWGVDAVFSDYPDLLK